MNNIFDIKRFANYFAYNLRRAGNSYGISLLVLGLMPVILLVLHMLGSLFSSGSTSPVSDQAKFTVFCVVVFVTAVSAGVKIYGSVTDKRAGSDFLMLPASTAEKWLSLSLMVCIVVPAALLALTLGSDALLSWLFPAAYGNGAIAGFCGDALNFTGNDDFYINIPAILFLGWCGCTLTFTLGGLLFKKAKVAKTFLCLFAIGTVLSLLAVLVVGSLDVQPEQLGRLEDSFNDPEVAIRTLNWIANISNFITLGGLLALIWLRLRTIKH